VSVQDTISPVDGSVYVSRPAASAGEIDAMLDRSVAARAGWRAAPLDARVQIVRAAVDWIVERADDLGRELTWQMGRPIAHSPLELRRGFDERARHLLEIAPGALADVVPEPRPGFRRFIRREPLGTVLVLAPWNFPYLTSVNAVVPALLAGNTVVLKTASQTPLVAERWSDALTAAGLPEGVFQHVHAGHAEVARMIADDRTSFVAFTGSVEGGHAVQHAAADRFIATGLELGGKDPAYVRPDAPEGTVAELVDGAFFNAGQSCCAVERIYVHRDRYDAFVEEYVELARRYVLGDPTDGATTLGPLVRTAAADWVRAQVAEAVQQGATALLDPADFPADRTGSPYLAPQVLVGVDHSMRLMAEETFGPAIGIMPVDGDDAAVHLMNDSAYGLTASIWSDDVDAAEALGDRLDTGTVYLNRCDYLDPALAWTGVKDSGRGVTLSRLGIEAMTRPKSFHLRAAL
jgi:acyl-CoA reductase-like NAD-dependent aldehyde dehydrogenase